MTPPSDPNTLPAEHRLPSDVLIAGGKNFTVTLLDGTSRKVFVRLVKLSECMRYYEVVGDMNAFVDFVTGEDGGFCDTLTDDSAFAVDELGKELNDFRCSRYLARQRATRAALRAMAERIVSPNSVPKESPAE